MSSEERLDRIEQRLGTLEWLARDRDDETRRLAQAVADLAQTIDLSERGVLRS